jgi:hypothetical protein
VLLAGVILARSSSQAAGWNLTFISPVEKLGAHFLPRNRFDPSGVKLSHASHKRQRLTSNGPIESARRSASLHIRTLSRRRNLDRDHSEIGLS